MKVIFRDFKTSNVLLDENFQAKLSDFGLAREGPAPGRTHVSTAVSSPLHFDYPPIPQGKEGTRLCKQVDWWGD